MSCVSSMEELLTVSCLSAATVILCQCSTIALITGCVSKWRLSMKPCLLLYARAAICSLILPCSRLFEHSVLLLRAAVGGAQKTEKRFYELGASDIVGIACPCK